MKWIENIGLAVLTVSFIITTTLLIQLILQKNISNWWVLYVSDLLQIYSIILIIRK